VGDFDFRDFRDFRDFHHPFYPLWGISQIKIWFFAHLLNKFLTLNKRNSFLLFSLNRNFRNFALF